MIKTLLNPNHVLSDCDNISDIDGQRMATVLGKHIYGYKPSDPDKPIIKVLGLDANDDVRWNEAQSPIQTYVGGNGIKINDHVVSIDTDVVQKKLTAGPNIDIIGDNPVISTEKAVVAAGPNISVSSSLDGEHRRVTYTVSAAAPGSTVNKKNYGDLEPSRVSTLTVDSDDPEGYTVLRADGEDRGGLVVGPYKGLLDSGVDGVGDSSHPIYIGSDGAFHQGDAVGSTYTAGTGININSSNQISCTVSPGPTYTAGTNVQIQNNQISATDTTYNVFSTSADGLVPKANGTGDTGKFLRGDHTWQYPATGSAGDANHPNYITQDANGQLHYVRAPRLFWEFNYNHPSIELTATDISNGYAEFVFVLGTEGLAIAETGNIVGIKGYDISMGNSLNGKQMSFYLVNHGGGSPRMLIDTGFETFTESVVNNYSWKAFKALGLTANRNVSKLDAVLRVPLSSSAVAGNTLEIPGHVTVTIFGIATNDNN